MDSGSNGDADPKWQRRADDDGGESYGQFWAGEGEEEEEDEYEEPEVDPFADLGAFQDQLDRLSEQKALDQVPRAAPAVRVAPAARPARTARIARVAFLDDACCCALKCTCAVPLTSAFVRAPPVRLQMMSTGK
eukprot:5705027-Prymnesium_polylepis.1